MGKVFKLKDMPLIYRKAKRTRRNVDVCTDCLAIKFCEFHRENKIPFGTPCHTEIEKFKIAREMYHRFVNKTMKVKKWGYAKASTKVNYWLKKQLDIKYSTNFNINRITLAEAHKIPQLIKNYL